jgi:GT2 family glycosyltransferase
MRLQHLPNIVKNIMKTISILIPIHNRLSKTQDGLRSLYTALEYYRLKGKNTVVFGVIVVDDGSTDGSFEWILGHYSDIMLLKGDGNLWWSGAINMGARFAIEGKKNDYILLWNDDTICEKIYFLELEKIVMNARYNSSIVASKIYLQDETNKLFNYGCYYNRENGKKTLIGYGQKDSDKYQSVKEIDWSGGMGTLIPSSIVKDVGYFDSKNFPQYHGDSDFFLRAQNKGYKAFVIPTLKIWNNEASTGLNKTNKFSDISQILKTNRSYINLHQNVLFNRRHSNTIRSWIHLSLYYLNFLTKSLANLINPVRAIRFRRNKKQYQ